MEIELPEQPLVAVFFAAGPGTTIRGTSAPDNRNNNNGFRLASTMIARSERPSGPDEIRAPNSSRPLSVLFRPSSTFCSRPQRPKHFVRGLDILDGDKASASRIVNRAAPMARRSATVFLSQVMETAATATVLIFRRRTRPRPLPIS